MLQNDSNQDRVVLVDNWHIGQQKRIENPETNIHKYVQWIFDKSSKAIQWIKNSFLTSGVGTNGHL